MDHGSIHVKCAMSSIRKCAQENSQMLCRHNWSVCFSRVPYICLLEKKSSKRQTTVTEMFKPVPKRVRFTDDTANITNCSTNAGRLNAM